MPARHEKRTASQIYRRQNRLLHGAFAALGMPYDANKYAWLPLFEDVTGRPVAGLSDLTLGERAAVINHFQSRGLVLRAPAVPPSLRDWRKGDPDEDYGFTRDENPTIRMIYAMWTEMGYKPRTLRGLCYKLFGVADPRWLDDAQLRRLVNTVRYRAKQKHCGAYYG